MASSDIVIRLELHVESFFPFNLVSQVIIDLDHCVKDA